MERKRDDWRIFALIFGDTVTVRRQEFWIRSSLSQLDFEPRDLQASFDRQVVTLIFRSYLRLGMASAGVLWNIFRHSIRWDRHVDRAKRIYR